MTINIPARLRNDPAFSSIVRGYLNDAPAQMAEMRRAIGHNDAEALSIAAYTLAGNSGMLHASSLVERCRRLEQLARIGDFHGCAAQLPEVEAAVQGTMGCLRQYT